MRERGVRERKVSGSGLANEPASVNARAGHLPIHPHFGPSWDAPKLYQKIAYLPGKCQNDLSQFLLVLGDLSQNKTFKMAIM